MKNRFTVMVALAALLGGLTAGAAPPPAPVPPLLTGGLHWSAGPGLTSG